MTHATLAAALRALGDIAHRVAGDNPDPFAIISVDVDYQGPRIHLTDDAFFRCFDGQGAEQTGRQLSVRIEGVEVFCLVPETTRPEPRAVVVGGAG